MFCLCLTKETIFFSIDNVLFNTNLKYCWQLHSNVLKSEQTPIFFHWKIFIKTKCASASSYLKRGGGASHRRFTKCLEILHNKDSKERCCSAYLKNQVSQL